MTEWFNSTAYPATQGDSASGEKNEHTQCEPVRHVAVCHQRRISRLTRPQEGRDVLLFFYFVQDGMLFADGGDCCNQQETFPALSPRVLTEHSHPFGAVGYILSALEQGSSPVAARSTLEKSGIS